MKIDQVLCSELVSAPQNLNVMGPQEFTHLKQSIETHGFVQPILAHASEGETVIIDGHHRVEAARELGYEELPAVILEGEEVNDSRIMSIAMNRIRGQVDLAGVSLFVQELSEEGYDLDDLTVMGFSTSELDDLIEAAQESDIDPKEMGAEDAPPGDKSDRVPKPFLLEVTFRSREELKKVKKAIKKAAGKGGDLATGLLRLIGEEE